MPPTLSELVLGYVILATAHPISPLVLAWGGQCRKSEVRVFLLWGGKLNAKFQAQEKPCGGNLASPGTWKKVKWQHPLLLWASSSLPWDWPFLALGPHGQQEQLCLSYFLGQSSCWGNVYCYQQLVSMEESKRCILTYTLASFTKIVKVKYIKILSGLEVTLISTFLDISWCINPI